MKRSVLVAPLAAALAMLTGGSALASQYQLMIYETPSELAKRSDTGAAGKAYWDAYAAYGAALQTAGVLRGGSALQPGREARTVTMQAGQRIVANAPAAASVAQLGGYFLIDVDTLEDALAWAARAPSAATGGAAEVRPLYPVPAMTPPR